MQGRLFTFERPANPLLQALYFLAGGALLVAALVMGAVIVAVGLGLALVAGLVVWVRLWWLGRRMARTGRPGAAAWPQARPLRGDRKVIEVEYTVVEERDLEDRRD